MRNTVRTQSLERVDLLDFDALADDLLRDNLGQVVDGVLTDSARQRQWVLNGFAMTNPAAKQLQVARGRALLGTRVDGLVEYGLITTDGDLTKTVDLNAYAAGVYGVYIRFERVQSELESRAFWDPSGGGSEYSQAINTRWTANWSVRVEAGIPGAEWLQIGQVDQATMAITDMRPFFFEGRPDDVYESGWSTEGGGIANDRNANRATYGTGDLQMFSAAVRQCLEDLKGRGLRRWWDKGIGGMNVGFDADPTEDILCVGDDEFGLSLALALQPRLFFGATEYMEYDRTGNWYHFVTGGAIALEVETGALGPGTAGKTLGMAESGLRWGIAYLDDLDLNQVDGHGVINDLKPAVDDVSDLGTATRRWGFLRVSKDVLADRAIEAGTDVTAGAGLFGVDLTLTGNVKSNLTNTPTGTYSLGTDPLRWKELFLSSLLDIKSTTAAYLKMYGGSAAANNRYWHWTIGASGELILQGGTDAGAALFDLLGITRSGVTPGTALLSVRGAVFSSVDSGYPATHYPATRVGGVNPILRLEDYDPTIDPECSMWALRVRNGGLVGDDSSFSIGATDSAGAIWTAFQIFSTGGVANQAAPARINLTAGLINLVGINEVNCWCTLAIGGDSGAPALPASDVGFTNDHHVGAAAGLGFVIRPAVLGGGAAQDSTGFIGVWVDGTKRYIPFFDTYTG